MSHGDAIVRPPEGFRPRPRPIVSLRRLAIRVATSTAFSSIPRSCTRRWREVLRNFVVGIAG